MVLFGLGAGGAREHIARERIAREFRARLLHTGIQVFLAPHDDDLAALCSAGDVAPLEGIVKHVLETRVWLRN